MDVVQTMSRYNGYHSLALSVFCVVGINDQVHAWTSIFPLELLLSNEELRTLLLEGKMKARDATIVINTDDEDELRWLWRSWRLYRLFCRPLFAVVGVRARAPEAPELHSLFYAVLTEVLLAHRVGIVRLDVSLVLAREGGLTTCLNAIGSCTSVTGLKIDATRLVEHAACDKRLEIRLQAVVKRMSLKGLDWKGFWHRLGPFLHLLTRVQGSLQRLALSGTFTEAMTRDMKKGLRALLVSPKGQKLRMLDFSGYEQLLVDDIRIDHVYAAANSRGSRVEIVKVPARWDEGFWRRGGPSMLVLAGQQKRLDAQLTVIVTNADATDSTEQADRIWQTFTGSNLVNGINLMEECVMTESERAFYAVY